MIVRPTSGGVGPEAGVTVTVAVGPDGVTAASLDVPPASLAYSPGVSDTVTPKWRVMLPEAGTTKGPVQVNV